MDAPPPTARDLFDRVAARARELGFDRVGATTATALEREREELEEFLAEGRHASMEWLARDPERRCDPQLVLPGCRTVLVLTMPYWVQSDGLAPETPTGKISKYATGRDYHRVLDKRLKKLARFINQEGPEGTQSKPYVDHGPVMERHWAARADLGFIGKHTLLIDPSAGSYFFLAVILTTAKLESPTTNPITEGCGACTRCIEACPTDAITEPWRFDARRCISYLTIEHRGAVDEELASRFEGWVFGCDICQDVCPYNRKRAVPREDDPFEPRPVPEQWSLVDALGTGDGAFQAEFRQSPLRRTGREGMARNAALAAAGTADPQLRAALERTAESDPSDVVRGAARWALDQPVREPGGAGGTRGAGSG